MHAVLCMVCVCVVFTIAAAAAAASRQPRTQSLIRQNLYPKSSAGLLSVAAAVADKLPSLVGASRPTVNPCRLGASLSRTVDADCTVIGVLSGACVDRVPFKWTNANEVHVVT